MNTRKTYWAAWSLLAAVLALGGTPGLVSPTRADTNEVCGSFSPSDFKFVVEALRGGSMEVRLGEMAAHNASSASVQEFGQRMVTDHQKAYDQLTQLAAQKGAVIPKPMPKKEENVETKLGRLNGTRFDQAYMKDMLHDHKKDVKTFEKEAASADDKELRDWVSNTLPTLRQHLSLAETTLNALPK